MGLHMLPPPPSECDDMDFVMGPRKPVQRPEPEFVSDPYTALEIEAEPGFSVERPRVLSVLSNLLEKLVARNEARALSGGPSGRPYSSKLTVFHGLRAPTISIEKYLERIFKYANCSPACFVVAYVYIDRLMQRQPDLPITSLNVHRLLITSVMTAAKFLDDAFYCNSFYGKVGGVTTAEMNRLELEFLFRLDFRLNVTTATFDAYTCHLEKELIRSGGYQIERPLTPMTPPICDIVTCSSEAAYNKQKLALSPSSAFTSSAIAACGGYPYSR